MRRIEDKDDNVSDGLEFSFMALSPSSSVSSSVRITQMSVISSLICRLVVVFSFFILGSVA